MQIKKAVSIRANPLPYQCFDVSMCTIWGNTLFGRLVLKSKLVMQEQLPNHQETQRNEAFPSCMWQKNRSSLNEHRWEMMMIATKRLKEWKWILALWAPYSQLTPKTSGSCLERQFTSFCLNFLWNVLKVKTFLLFKQTKPRVCAPSRRTRSWFPERGMLEEVMKLDSSTQGGLCCYLKRWGTNQHLCAHEMETSLGVCKKCRIQQLG